MLQRIQSLYLFLAFLIQGYLLILFFNNRWLPNIIECGVISILLLISIFLFKKRKVQLILNKTILILELLMLILFILGLFFFVSPDLDINLLDTFVLINFGARICTVIFIILANRAIKKDEALVRSIDRLR